MMSADRMPGLGQNDLAASYPRSVVLKLGDAVVDRRQGMHP